MTARDLDDRLMRVSLVSDLRALIRRGHEHGFILRDRSGYEIQDAKDGGYVVSLVSPVGLDNELSMRYITTHFRFVAKKHNDIPEHLLSSPNEKKPVPEVQDKSHVDEQRELVSKLFAKYAPSAPDSEIRDAIEQLRGIGNRMWAAGYMRGRKEEHVAMLEKIASQQDSTPKE